MSTVVIGAMVGIFNFLSRVAYSYFYDGAEPVVLAVAAGSLSM